MLVLLQLVVYDVGHIDKTRTGRFLNLANLSS